MKEWTTNIMKAERQRMTPESLTQLEESGEDLMTNLPQDLFTLINNQLAILGGQIKGELYIEVIRVNSPLLSAHNRLYGNFLNKTGLG